MAQEGPSLRSVEASFRAVVDDGESETALQRNLTAAEFVHDEGKVPGVKRLLCVGCGGDALGFIASVRRRVFRQQGSNYVGAVFARLRPDVKTTSRWNG